MTEDHTKLVEKMLGGVRDYVQRSLQPFVARLKTVEDRQPERGEQGDQGPEGTSGRDGRDGADGPRGEKGEPGVSIKGDPGKNGRDGKDGIEGKDGQIGLKGRDADPEEVRAMVRTLFAEIPAPKDGLKGRDGVDGRDGAPGHRGEAGISIKGDPGTAGEPGRDGRDGEPGLDALQLEVLPHIDSIKRYQRGTYAVFRGGLVRSYKVTDPLPEGGDLERFGWHVVVRGIDEIACEMGDDGRTIGIAIKQTCGNVVIKSIKVPAMIYRGIWKEGDTYQRGDSATRDGSTWVLMADEQKGRPGDSDSGWLLSVKRGRDGLRGEKGERGVEGRAVN